MATISFKDYENISELKGKVHRNYMKLTDQIKNKELYLFSIKPEKNSPFV